MKEKPQQPQQPQRNINPVKNYQKLKLVQRRHRMKFSDLYKPLPNSKLESKAKKEATRRIKTLSRQEDDKCLDLSYVLEDCNETDPCNSASCPICVNNNRAHLIRSAIDLFKGNQPCQAITVIYFNSEMSDEDLKKESIDKLRNRLYAKMKRSGFKTPVIGSFEVDYYQQSKKWLPHFHLMAPTNRAATSILKTYFPKDRSVYIRDVYTSDKWASYFLKFYWGRFYSYTPTGSIKPTRSKKVSLTGQQYIKALTLQHELGINGQLFLYGARFQPKRMSFSVNGRRKGNR